MRIGTGKKIVTHKLRSGRTGKAHYVKRKARKNGEEKSTMKQEYGPLPAEAGRAQEAGESKARQGAQGVQ